MIQQFLLLLFVLGGVPGFAAQAVQDPAAQPPGAQEKAVPEQSSRRAGKKSSKHDRFVRINKDEKGRAISMDTSTIRYTKKMPDGTELSVELIGVVHIGEKDYYDAFNEQFKNYDGLLYELVAPEGTKVEARNDGGVNPVAALQKGMMAGLGLQFQLDHINYNASNFVHADMTPEEFGESMTQNNESVAKMFFRMLGTSAAMSGASGEAEMLGALLSNSEDRVYRLRRSAANQLIKMDVGMSAFEGDNGSTIITHRNAKAFKVLQAQIDSGKRKLGVFYGAGHLPDMERRLIEDFGMTPGEPKWQLAWKLRADDK
ncbi:MAG: hypothetical protein JNL67_13970 [Planctomycetaceae bacterium]|nr:hypothetical protein [Planctomycetaceae bacterium]